VIDDIHLYMLVSHVAVANCSRVLDAIFCNGGVVANVLVGVCNMSVKS
jgi:hypothetical protein